MRGKIPMRQCVGCQIMNNKKDMMRVLKTADEGIILDTTGKKNGRGAYICPNADCLKKARKAKRIDRAFEVTIPDEIYNGMEEEISADE